MTSDRANYQSPLASRYASEAMRRNFSDENRISTWRRLWLALAESEKELGLEISEEQLGEMRGTLDSIDFAVADRFERELRHDVMAHVHAWGEQCPAARPIVHLGATSCYVTDNSELILMRDALRLVRQQLVGAVRPLRDFAMEWRELPALGLTHYQPAQATTVGKRACLWLQDLCLNLDDLDHAEAAVRFRGVKGTTGTQASFLELFEGDHDKVRELDRRVTKRMGFDRTFGVTGQTYPRQLDFRVCQVLSGIAQSAHKFATDLRLLAGGREMEEPFGDKQIGSSAMPWKRNPMRSERICALSRFVISGLDNLAHTAANQWFERTLDDSANRRIVIAEMFLAIDAVLILLRDVVSGLVVRPEMIRARLARELPFLASEHLMMEAVKAGGDRQDVHEALRSHSLEAAAAIGRGEPNPLVGRLRADPAFGSVAERLDELMDPKLFVGRAPRQVEEFLADEVDPLLERWSALEEAVGAVRV